MHCSTLLKLYELCCGLDQQTARADRKHVGCFLQLTVTTDDESWDSHSSAPEDASTADCACSQLQETLQLHLRRTYIASSQS
jgi:hypothetical protein